MPSPHKVGPRALTPQHHWDAQTVPPRRKTKCQTHAGTEFSSPGKICPFRDHNENPAASGDSHVQTRTKSIRIRRQALRRRDGEAEAEKGIHKVGSKRHRSVSSLNQESGHCSGHLNGFMNFLVLGWEKLCWCLKTCMSWIQYLPVGTHLQIT